MKYLIFILLLFPLFLSAEWDQLFPANEDPALFHHVSVISGHLNMCLQDTIVQGPKPFPLTRIYTSGGALERMNDIDLMLKDLRGGWLIQGGWNILPHANLLFEPVHKEHVGLIDQPIDWDIPNYKMYLSEPSGNMITYSFSHVEGKIGRQQTYIFKTAQKNGQYSGILSARNNPQNNLLYYHPDRSEIDLILPDGGKRVYKNPYKGYEPCTCYYRLISEILPSQHIRTYQYDDEGRLIHIDTKNPSNSKTYSWVHFDIIKAKAPFHFQARTSDGKTLNYQALKYKQRSYLCDISSNCRSKEILSYTEGRTGIGARIKGMTFGNDLQFIASYYMPPDPKKERKWAENPNLKDFVTDKVLSLQAPVGKNGELLPIAEFSYRPGQTDARDVEKSLVRYYYSEDRITEIQYFDKNDKIHSILKFIWDGSRLRAKVFCDSNSSPVFAKTFQYDAFGNVIEETLWGQLSGLASAPFSLSKDGSLIGAETLTNRYSYLSKFNILSYQEEENGLCYQYKYKPNTDLLTSKFTCDKDKILIREFFFYDEDNLLTCEILDNGSTQDPNNLQDVIQRTIKRYEIHPQLGLPISTTELYWDSISQNEVMLKHSKYSYNAHCLIASEAIYDADGMLRYTLYTDYDDEGHIIRKTTPLGGENLYSYDTTGNLIKVAEVGHPSKIFTYDAAGRALSCEEIDKEGNSRTVYSTYDEKGRILSQTDARNNTTWQNYDSFGRCLSTRLSDTKDEEGNIYTPIIKFSYDIHGNLTSYTTPKNEKTLTEYNTLRKPLRITYPDGSQLLHIYNKNGTLAKSIYPDNTQIHYFYDLFQRMTSKTIYSSTNDILNQEQWVYNSFQLVSYTDPKGLTSIFSYDGAGRKIAQNKGGRITTYSYDALGFLERTTTRDLSQVEIHDVQGQVIEKWEEKSGQIENNTKLSYEDSLIKKGIRSTSQGEAIDLFIYDGEGKLIQHIDPQETITKFIYENVSNDLNQLVLKKTIIDPLGHRIIEISDSLNRIAQIEKQDTEGRTISHEEFFYDLSGNKAKRVSTVYLKDNVIKTIYSSWEYDSLGRIVKEIEADKKITLSSYNEKGLLKNRTLPSGISLNYFYDELGRITELKSSDKSIHYQYQYDKSSNPIYVFDVIKNISLRRTYNLFGELTEETSSLGFSLQWEYDDMGRCVCFTLPDKSSISYAYQGGHLNLIDRRSDSNQSIYKHRYTHFDCNGHVAQEEVIKNLGTIQSTRDLLERPLAQTSKWFAHRVVYGATGLVDRTENSLFKNKAYTYDALGQLTKEDEKEYLFDSVGNPAKYETNDFNQILSTPDSHLVYDADGNLIERILSGQTISYAYDALGRLTSITYPEKRKVEYSYDPLSRLMTKELYTYHETDYQKEKNIHFLYDQDKEIGTLNPQGEILQLKVIGLGIKGDIGASIAIELGKEIFAPLHDFSGNIIALISLDGQLAETYQIDAFGKEIANPKFPLNPWRFCSKRNEEDLVFFGTRFYDLSLERWMTPDPAGFIDGVNLYAYVRNSPLNRLDLFGLSCFENEFPTISIEAKISSILKATDNSKMVHARGVIDDVNVDWYAASGHWHQMNFTPDEIKVGRVNILDHFAELLPKEGQVVGLITMQNGINTSMHEFKNMSRAIARNIPEGSLYLGMYNPSEGFFKDLYRAGNELIGVDTTIVSQTSQFMEAVIDRLHAINPELIWHDIRHSEAGVIGLRAIELLRTDHLDYLQKQMDCFAIAPALPIPKKFGMTVYNIYSEADHVTKRAATPYMGNSDYNIEILPSKSKQSERVFLIADHAFMGTTYQMALERTTERLRASYGFYNGNIR